MNLINRGQPVPTRPRSAQVAGAGRQIARGGLSAVALAVALLTFAAPAPAAPPDGRSYELVSTVDTRGRPVQTASSGYGVALGEDRFLWGNGFQPLGEAPSSGGGSAFVSERTPNGWRTTSLSPAPEDSDAGSTYTLLDASEDLSTTILRNGQVLFTGPFPGTYASSDSLVRRDADGRFETLVSMTAQEMLDTGFTTARYGGMSSDGDAIVYSSPVPPAGLPSTGLVRQVYLQREGQAPAAIGVDDQGEPLSACGAVTAQRISQTPDTSVSISPNSVSADGDAVFFQSPPPMAVGESGPTCAEKSQAYVRRGSSTVRLGGSDTSRAVSFLGATPDGRTAYVMTDGALLPAVDLDATFDVYRVDLPTGGGAPVLSCVSCSLGGTALADVSAGQVAVTPLGDHVYFGTTGPKLYAYDGDAADVRIVDPAATGLNSLSDRNQVQFSHDGTVAVYARSGPGGVAELYRAVLDDDGTAATQCVSCRPDATPSASYAALEGGINPGDSPGAAGASGPAGVGGALSKDGSTVAFESYDVKTDGAVAGRNGTGFNIYRWQEGRPLALVSAPGAPSNKLAISSPSGDTIYFVSGDPLAREAPNVSAKQWYAARVGEGFPAPPAPPVACVDDGCRGGPADPPALPLAGSTTGSPFGNAPPPPSAKGEEPTLRVSKPSARERRQLASSGRLRLRIAVRGAGRVTVKAQVRIGGRSRPLASTAVTAKGAGSTVRPQIRLSTVGKRELARRGRLRIQVSVAMPGAPTEKLTITLTLKRSA